MVSSTSPPILHTGPITTFPRNFAPGFMVVSDPITTGPSIRVPIPILTLLPIIIGPEDASNILPAEICVSFPTDIFSDSKTE